MFINFPNEVQNIKTLSSSIVCVCVCLHHMGNSLGGEEYNVTFENNATIDMIYKRR